MKNFTGAQGAVIVRLLIESYRAKAHRILEAGFTGQKKDKLGHTRYYQNGRQVKNPNAKEKSAIHAAASTSLPAGQAPSHADAATRVDALHADTPPEHVAALANDLMKMSVADLTKMAKAPAEEEPKQKRANAGGEVGPNGEHYKGGAFIATTEMPKSMKDKIKRAAGDGMETVRDLEGNVTREKPPHPGMMSISGTMMGTLIGRKGEVNEQYLDYLQASPEKRKQVADLAEKYRAGEHWAPINDYPNVALGKHIYQLAAAGLPIAGSLLGRLKGNADFQKYYKKQTEKAAPAAAPAPTPDKTPTAAANKPAFTGTDAQGRQWQDGELVAAKDKPPAPTAGMSADANALDALRLKSNKKTHNPAHINPEALSSLKAQGFIDDKNKLTPAGRTHLYAEKLKGAPAPTGSAAATPAAPKPKWKRANRNKDSLISIVKRKGGINSNSVKKDYDYQADIIEGGLLHAIRKQGMGLDEMAASLQVEGHIIVPEGVDPGDYLLDRMKGRHHSALRNTDKEIESEAEAFYKAQHEAKQGGHDERSIEGSRRSGAQTGKSAGQKEGATELDEWDNSGAGETGGGEKDATVSGDGYDSADTDDYDRNAGQDAPVDNSFDFGANADEPKADEPAPAPATAAPTAALKKDPRDKTYEKLIKKGKPIHNATDDDNGIHEIDRKHITPELRRLLQSEQSLQRGWDGPPEETESFQLKDKSDVTGDPLDDGMILIDKRKKNLALKQRHLDTLHAAGKNTDSEANDKKAKANADVENAIMHHLKNNYDATGTELRRAGGHKEYDENDPTSNPVHAALDRLEKSGKIKKGSGGNPLYSKADEAPAPTTDEAPATPAPDQPGFTGVDSQGREWQNGELVAAKDDEPAPAGKAEPEPEPKAAGKEQPETIGKGSTGDVTKQGDQVYKTANENESNAYSKLAGIDGVAPGKLEGDKIVTPFYKHVISVDTIPYEKRQTLGPILKPNLGRMVNAVTALSDEGLSYNDPLQFGFDKDKKSNLLDFSMAEKVDNAPRENLSALANYLKQFGLSKHGDAMTQVALVSDYITPGSRWLDDDSTDSIDGAKIEANLDGKPGKYAYYSFNARTIPGVAQTGHRDAANVIFSDKPLSNEFMETWEIHPAIHRTDAKTDEPEPKAAPEPAAATALNNAPTTDDIKRTAAIQKEKSNNMHKGMEWNLADDGMVTVHHAVTGREIGKIDLDTKKLYPSRSDEDSKQKLSGIYDHLEKLTQTQSDREKIQSLLDRPHKGNNKNEILELNNKIAERGHKPEPVPDYLTPAAAPEPDPVTEPSTPAAAAAEPQPNDTPRTVAARVSAAMADEFEGARNSTLPNMGQDTPGSARHKAMAWKGLKDAEANGTAEALVKRDELLKNDPSNLSSILAPENFLGVLTSHLTMQAFPKEVLTYAEYVKNEKHHVSTPAQLREQYYEAFTEIKKLTEDLSTKKLDPRVIASEVNKKINGLIEKFRKEGQGEPSARPGRRHDGDSYNPVANSLISMQKRVLGGGANSVVGRVNDFGKRLFTATGEMSYNSKEKAVSAVADILEGKSFNQAFDTVNQKKKEFDFNEAYGGEVTRTGGKKIDMSEQSTSSPGAKVFMDDMKVRGVQFGNSLPDQERVYHAQKSAEALSDLTSILGLPDEAAGLGGKLGLAIGARGKGGALAHFEPYQANDRHNPDVGGPVINLTRANGAGSLAHEWGHGLDHYAANNKAGGGKFLSHPEASRGGAGGSPETIEAMKKVQEAMGNSGFDNRLIDETVRRRFSGSRRQYWTSPEEKFARTFERHVQNKLHEAGRENTYLTGLHKQGHPLWPTNDEMAHMAPHMDALISAIAAEKFPGHKMPTPAPAAPRAAAPAPKEPAPKEEKPATATAAWKQRGSNEKESPYQSFQAIHGRPPSFDELHGDKFEKIKGKYVLKPNYEEVNGKYVLKPNQGGTITDVTPAGYGPGEADTPPAAPAPGKFLRMRDLKDAHRLPPDDLVKKHGWSWTGTDEKGNQWHNGRFIGEEGTYKEAVMPAADPHAEKIKLIQTIIARRGLKPPQPKAQAKKIPEASEDADPRVKRIRELMDAYC